jgi:hypothetical protein
VTSYSGKSLGGVEMDDEGIIGRTVFGGEDATHGLSVEGVGT